MYNETGGLVNSTVRRYMHTKAIKDEEAAHPIASSWRPILHKVVRAFADGDYSLECGIEGVETIDADIAAQNKEYVNKYGERLVDLTDECWNSSCAQWMGAHWEVLLDLCTEREGVSDLVLSGTMREVGGNSRFSVGLIYVP